MLKIATFPYISVACFLLSLVEIGLVVLEKMFKEKFDGRCTTALAHMSYVQLIKKTIGPMGLYHSSVFTSKLYCLLRWDLLCNSLSPLGWAIHLNKLEFPLPNYPAVISLFPILFNGILVLFHWNSAKYHNILPLVFHMYTSGILLEDM